MRAGLDQQAARLVTESLSEAEHLAGHRKSGMGDPRSIFSVERSG